MPTLPARMYEYMLSTAASDREEGVTQAYSQNGTLLTVKRKVRGQRWSTHGGDMKWISTDSIVPYLQNVCTHNLCHCGTTTSMNSLYPTEYDVLS